MKAQLFESKSEKEIRLSNGVQFFSEEGETKEAFVARVTEVIERDYVDTLELTEVELSTMKRKSTKQLQKSRSSATGVELRMIQEILVDRGALEEHPSEDGSIVNTTLTDEDITAEGSGQEVADAQPEEPKDKKEKAPKKEKSPKTEKEPKPLKKQLTEEEILPRMDAAEKNKGHEVIFLCTKTKEETKGVIKGVRLDKRNNFIQYRILAEDGNMYGKGIDSEDLKIGDLAPVPVKEKAPKKEKAPATEEAAPAEESSIETQTEE